MSDLETIISNDRVFTGSGSLVATILGRVADAPDKDCLIFADETLRYRDLLALSLRWAQALRGAGVGAGDVVMIFLPTHPDTYAAFLGAMLLGSVPAYMPGPSAKQKPDQYWRDHAALLARTTPRAIVTNDATAAAMASSGLLDGADVAVVRGPDAHALPMDAIVAASARDVAFLQHSSGTTGLKKGVMLGHGPVLAQVDSYRRALDATPDDIVATWLPVYHDMGLITSTLMPLLLGQTIVVLDPFAWTVRPASLFEAIGRYRATLVWQPNFAFEHLVRTVDVDRCAVDLSCVRAFVNCSEPCRPASFTRFAAQFASLGVRPDQLQVCYAMAETVFAVTQTPPGQAVRTLGVSAAALRDEGRARAAGDGEERLELLSNGPPIDGLEAMAVRPDGRVCDEGEVGELLVRGHCLFDGYFRLEQQTRERLGTAGLRTRDMGFVEGGEVFVLGRMDDLIIVHGRNFYAGEVEAAVGRVAGIKPGRTVAFGIDNAAVGSQDIVVVAERATDDEAPADLGRRVKAAILQEVGLAVHEVVVAAPGWLSKTTSGKISREHNRARYLQEKAGAAYRA